MCSIERFHSNARMSRIVRYAGLIHLCGQTANRSASAAADIAAQTREVLARIDALLGEAGSSRSRLVSVTIYLRDMADFDGMNTVWESWLDGSPKPARTTVQAAMSAPHLRVEMTAVAAPIGA
jgi:enamine deaminase RidA (YjgF/YER057c/UK114 family)